MRAFGKIALTVLATTCPVAGVLAADAVTVPTSSQTPIAVPVHDSAAFDWNGFYAGVHGNVQTSDAGGTRYGLGLHAGVNASFDFYLVGAEVAVQGLTGGVGDTSYGQILGRAGLVVTDDVAVYAAGGYGIDLGVPEELDYLLGGGVEMSVSDDISVRAQYLHSFPAQGGNPKDQFSVGATYHF